MSKEIVLFPFGGNARESLLSILAINRIRREWDIIGFMDDNPFLLGKDCCGIKVIGGREVLEGSPEAYILAVPGNPGNYLRRKEIIENLNVERSRYARIIHPSAMIAPDAEIGYNTIIMANVVISCGVTIGNHCIILPNTVISHDSVVSDCCCIGSNVAISGYVVIAPNCYIGSGTNIREKTHIREGTLVGLGSNVISNIEGGMLALGNPARVIRRNSI